MSGGVSFDMRVKFRTDGADQLLKELAFSPLIYIRIVAIICSIVVFGCVADQVQQGSVCLYAGNNDCCNFAIAIGVIGFLLCLAFLVKDVLYVILDFSDNPTMKKAMLIVDIAANGLWALMWFVAFVFTAAQLNKTDLSLAPSAIVNCARSGVAFSFFSTLLWIAIVVINVILLIRIIKGMVEAGQGGGGYASFPSDSSPDAEGGGASGGGQPYSPPEY